MDMLGKPAPKFSGPAIVNGQQTTISLDQYKGKYVILFFYPMDFTFVCPTEIISFSESAEKFKNLNCEVIACSTDSEYSHLAWVNTPRKKGGLGELDIPLLADKSMEIAKAYKVLRDDGIAWRGLFIIDDKQILRQITMNDLPIGRSVDEALRLLEAIQHFEKHGEVCPANWIKGSKTMKADPVESQDYFSNQY